MIQIWQLPSECGPSNLVVLVTTIRLRLLGHCWNKDVKLKNKIGFFPTLLLPFTGYLFWEDFLSLNYVLLVKWEPVSHFGYTQRVQCINIDIFPYKKGEPELSVCRKVTRETANSFPVSHPLNPLHRAGTTGKHFENCSKSTPKAQTKRHDL